MQPPRAFCHSGLPNRRPRSLSPMPVHLLTTFKERFSPARMEPYEIAVDDDPDLTIALYDWNIQIGSTRFSRT